jgi:hypothetical protein
LEGEIKENRKDGSLYGGPVVPFLNDKGKPYQYAIRSDITEKMNLRDFNP